MTEKLADRAMMVSLHQRAWQGNVRDDDISSTMVDHYGAEPGTIKAIKSLTPISYVKPIIVTANYGRREHYHLTVPGFVKGQQLLATKVYERYVGTQQAIQSEFEDRVKKFIDIYPDILASAPQRLNKAYKEEDFPTVKQIATYFEYAVNFSPVPNIDDWRLDGLGKENETDVRLKAENRVRSMYDNAVQEMFRRAHEVLSKIAKQADEYEDTKGGLKDVTIKNLHDMTELVLSMNITNNPLLVEIGNEMRDSFAGLDGKELRTNADLRESISDRAKRILDQIKSGSIQEAA